MNGSIPILDEVAADYVGRKTRPGVYRCERCPRTGLTPGNRILPHFTRPLRNAMRSDG